MALVVNKLIAIHPERNINEQNLTEIHIFIYNHLHNKSQKSASWWCWRKTLYGSSSGDHECLSKIYLMVVEIVSQSQSDGPSLLLHDQKQSPRGNKQQRDMSVWQCEISNLQTRKCKLLAQQTNKHLYLTSTCVKSWQSLWSNLRLLKPEKFYKRDRLLWSFWIEKATTTKVAQIPPLPPSHALFTAQPGNLLANHSVVLQLKESRQWLVEV